MGDLSAEEWGHINATALWIHAQHDISALQRGVLNRLTQIIPHTASFFDLCCVNEGRLMFFDPASTTMSDEDLSNYYQSYELSDYVAWCFTSAEAVIYRDSDMISDEAREQSLIYREWMQPIGLYYSMGSTIVDGGAIFGSVTLFRALGDPDFSESEMTILSELNRHLAVHFALLWPQGVFPDGRNEDIEALARSAGLSDREGQVMRLVAEGYTNREVGGILYISESTVKKHLNALYRKLKIENRVQLMRLVFHRPEPLNRP